VAGSAGVEPDIRLVQVAVEMVDTSGVEDRGAPIDAVHHAPLAQQQFREVGAVLARDASDQCDLVGHELPLPVLKRLEGRG